MNGKILLCFILFFTYLTGCQHSHSQNLLFAPKNTKKYHFELSSGSVNMEFNIMCHYYDKDSIIEMVTIIDEIQWKGSSEFDKEINADYQKYVGDSLLTVFDKYGHAVVNDIPKLQKIINAELFVLELPKKPILEGSIWIGKKSAGPDLFFDYIMTKHTCKKIMESTIKIYVEMSCKSDKNANTALKSLTKFYKGYYVIHKDGSVKSADLDVSGFSGLSNISGKMKISELP